MLRAFQDKTPRVHETAFVEESAHVIGDVELGAHSSVWFQCVIRADVNRIRIGHHTNIQDGTVIHVDEDQPAVIGARVTVGHRAIVHGCVIEDECLIGMGAVIMSGARIGSGSLVGAAALVCERQEIPPGSLVLGAPARVVGVHLQRRGSVAARLAAEGRGRALVRGRCDQDQGVG